MRSLVKFCMISVVPYMVQTIINLVGKHCTLRFESELILITIASNHLSADELVFLVGDS